MLIAAAYCRRLLLPLINDGQIYMGKLIYS